MLSVSLEENEKVYFRDTDGGYVSIQYEPYPENPLDFYDPLGTFYTWGSRHISPSENPYRTPPCFIECVVGVEKADTCESMQDALQALNDAGYAALGIYRYEHGGVAYALGEANPFNDYWDSGPVGFAFVAPEKLRAEGMTKEDALTCMRGEMEEYSAWANGEVFLVESYDEHGLSTDVRTYYGLDSFEADHPFIKPFDIGDYLDLASWVEENPPTQSIQELAKEAAESIDERDADYQSIDKGQNRPEMER